MDETKICSKACVIKNYFNLNTAICMTWEVSKN